ncbi:malonyl-CoA/methylmalonyl-CoA synthetase [Rubricella aquisinus]|uniref:3-methylmercaptopropionyl-CoA ligase n=1 Tax=Rubricella aquisinus TaxID=2028108 RepID=A0A840WG74_9RHOB|nr:malonyl-CoA synthase [Rubricella aquisinus]MBB5514158.1 malonyl-CoA/methylmalonyl-CoA synthetase [Rubricella aquisinus]
MTNPLYDALFGRHHGAETRFLETPDGAVWSHDRFLTLAARYANALTTLGLRAGDRLVLQAAKSPQALAVYAACVRAGIVFLPLNTGYTPDEVAYFLGDSGARLMLCDDAARARLAPIAGDATLMGMDAFDAAAAGQSAAFETVARGPDDLAALLYTSGTTGRSKGAMLSQHNLLSNAETLVAAWRFTAEDVLIHALPIFHTHGLFVASNVMLLSGGAMLFHPKFDRDQIIADLPRATSLMGVPTFYTRLLDDPRFTADLVAGMRLFTSGSAPLLAETHRQFEARTGHRILERYGMTETNMTTSNPYDGERRAGTVGPPLPGVEVRIMADGAEVAAGEIGVIEVRGPNVFQGYWQMPEKTAEELRPDGWFITGDLALMDPDGYVQIVGRGKDLIISGGFNIYPKEVEDVLDAQPGVLESAVIGAPHPDFGESPVALIVPEQGAVVDLDTLRGACREKLAAFKQPRHIALIDALPRNTMGKVQKAALRAEYAGVFR